MGRIEFNDGDRQPFEIPTSQEIATLSREKLRECAVTMSYALQHGSGAAVRLALPYTRVIAAMIQGGEKDPIGLVSQLEEEGREAGLGTVTVQWGSTHST